jgi:hypothetical protein
MSKISIMRKKFFLYTLLAFQVTLHAQQRTHLPYSAFGIGEIHEKGFVRNMGMGKSGIALSSNKFLNNMNPASYYSIDSISFFFDFGLSGDIVKYKTAYDPIQHGTDVNIRNIAIGFRINNKWSASVGIEPYSSVGYKIKTDKDVEGTEEDNFTAVLTGNGGLNQFYWNNSYLLFNHLSLGVNFTYLFGNIDATETATYTMFPYDIISKQTSYLNKVYADFGIQYFFPVKKDFQVTLGGVFGNSHKLNFKHRIQLSQSDGTIMEDEITRHGTFDFPMYVGGGIAVAFKDRLTFSADYLYHDWSRTTSDNPSYKYKSNNAIKLGVEFIPGHFSKLGYFGGISYRAGYYYEESYLEINNKSFSDNGITLGLGLPFLQTRTSVNIAYNFGINGTVENDLIRETYNSFMISLTLHDWWFIKRKYD